MKVAKAQSGKAKKCLYACVPMGLCAIAGKNNPNEIRNKLLSHGAKK